MSSALTWFSGAETSDLAEWSVTSATNGTIAVDTAYNAGGGAYSIKIVTTAATAPTVYAYTTQTAVASANFRFYLYIDSIPASLAYSAFIIAKANQAGAGVIEVGIQTDGSGNPSLWVRNAVANAQVGGAYAIAVGTTYCIELATTISATVGAVTLYVNGVSAISGTGLNTGTNNLVYHRICAQNAGSMGAATLHFDDCAYSTAGYIGLGCSIAAQTGKNVTTNSAPAYNTWTKSGGTNIYDAGVWNNTPYSNAGYAYSATNAAEQTAIVDFTTVRPVGGTGIVGTGDTINAVKVARYANTNNITRDGSGRDSAVVY